MTLDSYLTVYEADHEFGLRESTVKFHKAAIGTLNRFFNKKVEVADLNTPMFNQFLDWLKLNRKPDTFRTVRGSILTLWRHAAENGVATNAPIKLRKLRICRLPPVAWNPVEILLLIDASRKTQGVMQSGIPYSVFWEAIIRAAYDTGMRLGDLLALSPRSLAEAKCGATVRCITSKTGDAILRQLRPDAWKCVQACLAANVRKKDLVFPWHFRRETFYVHFSGIVKEAKIRPGTFRYIRRVAVTWADIDSPGTGQHLAGHKSERTTAESYRDTSQINEQCPAPMEIQKAAEVWKTKRAV
jgi:integrase